MKTLTKTETTWGLACPSCGSFRLYEYGTAEYVLDCTLYAEDDGASVYGSDDAFEEAELVELDTNPRYGCRACGSDGHLREHLTITEVGAR
jgi:DNA-directed RNA polymerase subunit RPC12/RpoP